MVNDDGYNAQGLRSLATILAIEHEVTVVAPESNCSGYSNSITINQPVSIRKVKQAQFFSDQLSSHNKVFPVYTVSGTPADCIYLALHTIFKESSPDFIISGINQGENLAEDTLYSGTVGAAMEGFLFGVPSIAVSQQLETSKVYCYDLSARVFREIFNKIVLEISRGLYPSKNILLNINIPYLHNTSGSTIDVKLTSLGRRQTSKPPREIKDEEDKEGRMYMIGAHGDPPVVLTPGTDLHAIALGQISLTPLQIDLTNTSTLNLKSQAETDFRIHVPDMLEKKVTNE